MQFSTTTFLHTLHICWRLTHNSLKAVFKESKLKGQTLFAAFLVLLSSKKHKSSGGKSVKQSSHEFGNLDQ